MLRRDLNEFFFGLRPATSLGLFRLCFGTIIVCWGLLLIPDFRVWYTERGLMTLEMMRAYGGDPTGFNLLADFNITDARVSGCLFAALIASAVMVAIGYKTRISSIVLWVLLCSFQHRDMLMLNGGDSLQRNMAFLLMFADSGRAVSVDRLIRVARGQERAGDIALVEMWPQRLLQLQLTVVYVTTCLSKLEGSDWQTGIALYYVLHLLDLHKFSVFGLQNNVLFIVPFTYGTLLTEFCMGTFVWVRRLRPYVLLMGVGLHLGIEYAMVVPLFSYTMLASYINFCYNEWLEELRRWLSKRLLRAELTLPAPAAPGAWQVSRTASLLAATDVFSLIAAPADDTASSSRLPMDTRLALRALWRLPVTWLAVLIPPILVLTLLPAPWLLISFGLFWLAAVTLSLARASRRLTAAYNSAPPSEFGDFNGDRGSAIHSDTDAETVAAASR